MMRGFALALCRAETSAKGRCVAAAKQ